MKKREIEDLGNVNIAGDGIADDENERDNAENVVKGVDNAANRDMKESRGTDDMNAGVESDGCKAVNGGGNDNGGVSSDIEVDDAISGKNGSQENKDRDGGDNTAVKINGNGGKTGRRGRSKLSFALRLFGRVVKKLIAIAVVLAILTAVYYYFRVYQPEHEPLPEYILAKAERRDIYSAVTATGKIAAKDDAALYVKATQKVASVLVKAGDRVEAGQLLITYDIESELKSLEQKLGIANLNKQNAELSAKDIALPAMGNELLRYISDVSTARKNIADSGNAIESYKIRINQQQIRVSDSKRLLDNNARLYDQGFLTRDEYDQSNSAFLSAKESLNDLLLSLKSEEENLVHRQELLSDAEKKLNNVRAELGDESSKLKYEQQLNAAKLAEIEIVQIEDEIGDLVSETRSPVDGYVAEVGAVEGGTVTRSSAVIRIENLTGVIVKTDIAQYDSPEVKTGQKVNIYFEGLPDEVFVGTVSRIAAGSVEKETDSGDEVIVPVDIEILNFDDRLKTGFNVDVDVITVALSDVLSVPSQAIVSEGGGEYVYILMSQEEAAKEYAANGDTESIEGAANGVSGMGADTHGNAVSEEDMPLSELITSISLDNFPNRANELFRRGLFALDSIFPHTVSDQPIPVRRRVITGLSGENGVEIISGISEGDSVILNP